MSRTCGSSKPTPTPLNGLAVKPEKTREKVNEGNADTIIRQTTVKDLPRTACVAGETRRKMCYDKANHRQKPPAYRQRGGGERDGKQRIAKESRRYDKGNQRQNPPARHHRGGRASHNISRRGRGCCPGRLSLRFTFYGLVRGRRPCRNCRRAASGTLAQ